MKRYMNMEDNIKYRVGELKLKNVIACRKKLSQTEAKEILNIMEQFIERNNLIKASKYINVTHGIEFEGEKIVLDIEILISVEGLHDCEEKNEEIRFVGQFVLNNALVCELKCSPLLLGRFNQHIEEYIKQEKLEAITPGYLMTKKTNSISCPTEEMEYEIYIGLKNDEGNIL